MSKKNIIKISLDVVMTIILVLLYNSHVFALAFHEIAGLALAGMFVIHCLLNIKWVTSVSVKFFRKSLAPRVRIGYIVNFLLLTTFVIIILSGIMTSQVLFPNIAAPKNSPWRAVHHFAAAISIILTGVHLGLHWGFIMGIFKKIATIPKAIAKPLSIILLTLIMIFGVYSIANSSFIGWLVEPFVASEKNSIQTSESGTESVKTEDKSSWDGVMGGSKPGENKSDSATEQSKPETNGAENTADHPAEEKTASEGSLAAIVNTITTYLSIIGLFTAITYYTDKNLKRKPVKNSEQRT